MARSDDLPVFNVPNSSRAKRKKGKVIQRRHYGRDGRAIVDIDFDHDHGSGKPHAHDWDWSQKKPVRLPGRALTAKEMKSL